MNDKTNDTLQQQWSTLHNNVERSESLALVLKMLAVVVLLVGLIAGINLTIIDLLLLVLWLQEGIWKTFQSRTELYLLDIEKVLLDKEVDIGLGFYSNWVKSRPGLKTLVLQYLSNAIRPTVAYPYVILLVISFVLKNL